MSEHDEIEEKLKSYRERRDRDLPADRRMLPVQKDQLLAEARRRYGPRASAEWFSPVFRWASVVAPILILAGVGYFWLGISKERRLHAPESEGLEVVRQSADLAVPAQERRAQIGGEKKEMLFSSEMDSRSSPEMAKAPASRNEPKPSVVARKSVASPAPAALPPSEAVAADRIESNANLATAMLDVSGQYQVRIGARDKSAVQKSKASPTDAMVGGRIGWVVKKPHSLMRSCLPRNRPRPFRIL